MEKVLGYYRRNFKLSMNIRTHVCFDYHDIPGIEHLGIFRVNDIVVVLNVEFSWG